ncbi:MAG: ABC transporter ATP-binding protein [Pleomorphochaeta sp.]
MSNIALKMDNITKVYPNGVVANHNIKFEVNYGEIHALSGENGAGKSTLMKILFGEEIPTEGKIYIDGQKVKLNSPSDALKLGIGMVHQHFMLVPSLTVLDNIILGEEPSKGGVFTDYKSAEKQVRALMEKYNMEMDPFAKVKDLSVGQKQKLEILKILLRGAKILILDEPTAVLTPQETRELFLELKLLRDEGYTVVFISHKLNEVRELCSRISVIRRGEYKGTFNLSDIDDDEISKLMVGRNVSTVIEKGKKSKGSPILEVKNLVVINEENVKKVDDISFKLNSNEIIGIAGVEGNGQSQLVETIVGQIPISSGIIKINDQEVSFKNIKQARNNKISYIPEDRMTIGMAGSLSITENIIADKIDDNKFVNKAGLLKLKEINEYGKTLVEKYEILCKNSEVSVDSLSGGNIQKVVLARELDNAPHLVIADQPTRGVDLGASEFIRKQLVNLSTNNCGILLISSDLNELLSISDKILVIADGTLRACIKDIKNTSDEDLGKYMLGIEKMSPQEIERNCYDA